MKIETNYFNGQWNQFNSGEAWQRENPSRISEVAFEAKEDITHVDLAVASAKKAFPSWKKIGFQNRQAYLEKLKNEFKKKEDQIARRISIEAGKPLWEAQGEARALVAKIDIMSTEGAGMVKTVNPESLSGRYRFRPLGPVAILGPFNFPAHLLNGHIIPALLHGNTLIVKPSEMTSGVMQLYFECVHEAGFPPGVINLLHGSGKTGAALSVHPDIRGIFFTGSWKTGLAIRKATLEMPFKVLALEMGGKNTSIILPDANLEQAAHEIALASYLTTGQRCSATSRVVLHESVFDDFVDLFTTISRRITTGDALESDSFMGPLINKAAYDNFIAAQSNTEQGVLKPLLKGGATEDKSGYFVKPAVWLAGEVNPKGGHQAEEIFGPDVVLYRASSDSEAVQIANATDYGLAMSIFSDNRERFDDMADLLEAGIVNLNRSTCGASSRLPFGGLKKSGNGMPSALFAPFYCTYPQAQLFEEAGWSDAKSNAGALSKLS